MRKISYVGFDNFNDLGYPLEMLRHISHGEGRTGVYSCGKSDDKEGNGKWEKLRLSLGCPKLSVVLPVVAEGK